MNSEISTETCLSNSKSVLYTSCLLNYTKKLKHDKQKEKEKRNHVNLSLYKTEIKFYETDSNLLFLFPRFTYYYSVKSILYT